MSLFSKARSPTSSGAGNSVAAVNSDLHPGTGISGSVPAAAWPSGTIEALKWFGVAAMAADHWAILVLADPLHPLRTIGRLALPIFLILLARNLAAGAGVGRYWLRLLPFALVSEIVWRWAEHAGAFRPPGANILVTLALAALFWSSLRRAAGAGSLGEKLILAFPALLALVLSTHVDYGPTALVFTSCVALLVQLPFPWKRTGGWLFATTMWAGFFACSAILAATLNLPFFGVSGLVAVIPLGLLLVPRLPDVKLPRAPWWVFYALYPAHVAILGLLGAALRG